MVHVSCTSACMPSTPASVAALAAFTVQGLRLVWWRLASPPWLRAPTVTQEQQTHRRTDAQTQAQKQTDRKRQTDRTDRQKKRQTQIQTDTHVHTYIHTHKTPAAFVGSRKSSCTTSRAAVMTLSAVPCNGYQLPTVTISYNQSLSDATQPDARDGDQ